MLLGSFGDDPLAFSAGSLGMTGESVCQAYAAEHRLEAGVGTKRVVDGVDLEGGKARGMCGDGFIDPSEGLVVVAKADVGADKSERIDGYAAIRSLQVVECAARLDLVALATVDVSL